MVAALGLLFYWLKKRNKKRKGGDMSEYGIQAFYPDGTAVFDSTVKKFRLVASEIITSDREYTFNYPIQKGEQLATWLIPQGVVTGYGWATLVSTNGGQVTCKPAGQKGVTYKLIIGVF